MKKTGYQYKKATCHYSYEQNTANMTQKSSQSENKNQVIHNIGKIGITLQLQHTESTIKYRTTTGCISQKATGKSIFMSSFMKKTVEKTISSIMRKAR